MVIGTDYNLRKKLIWGQGRLDTLKEKQMMSNATAVMINIDILSPIQQVLFETLM
jgi:50S ribosomal subunit-associated GTPase HflX